MAPRQFCIVIALMLVLTLSPYGALIGPQHASILKTPSSWTIMVYMADDYIPDLPWRDNINQMEAANQAPGTNIIVLVDPLGSNSSMLLRIERDNGTHGDAIISPRVNDSGEVIPSNGTVDMGSPDTLRSFIRFVATNFTADHLVLIMWGHAGGWRLGLCPDGSDALTLPEFREALAGATSDIRRNLDLIGIDACSEGSVEMLYELHPYADYLVASEKLVPTEGLPYTPILNRLALDPAQATSTFASGIAQSFIDWSRYNSSISASIGVFNLTRMGGLETNLDQLAVTGAKYDSLFHEDLNDALASALSYDGMWNVDFGDFLGRLLVKPLPPDFHKAVMDTMRSYLEVRPDFRKLDLANPLDGIHVDRSTGAVIYAPTMGTPDETYAELEIADGHWPLFGRLARHTGPTNHSGQVPALTYNDNKAGQHDSVTLTWSGQYESSEASVFIEEAGGLTYLSNISSWGNRTTISGEGHLTISANAMNGSVAQAHATVRVTLFGQTNIKVQIVEDGKKSTRDFDVRIIAKNSTYDSAAVSGTTALSLEVPTQVEMGDIVHVQVVDQGSGVVLGDARAVVEANTTAITVEIHPAAQNALPVSMTLLIALLPGLLILLFDLQLYLGDKKKGKKPSR